MVQNTLWRNAPNGIPGNDDLGSMSSWYVWTALGLYPGIPGRSELWITTPLFPRAVVRRANGKVITIDAAGASAANAFIEALSVNGNQVSRAWLTESFVRNGGTLKFAVSATANARWGSAEADVPPSFEKILAAK